MFVISLSILRNTASKANFRPKKTRNVFVNHYAPSYMLVHTKCQSFYACPYKMPKLERGITPTKLIFFFFSNVNQMIFSSAPVSSPNFKALNQTVIKISCSHEKHDKQKDR